MKVLILIAHCDKKGRSHAHKIAEASKEALLKTNHEVRIVDLLNSGFGKTLTEDDFLAIHDENRLNCQVEFMLKNNFSKEIEEQLDNLEWATHVIACGPMYWLNFPAIFYSWMEKVLCAMKTRVPNSKQLHQMKASHMDLILRALMAFSIKLLLVFIHQALLFLEASHSSVSFQ